MGYIYKNISGDTAQKLLTVSNLRNANIKAISMANIHSTNNVRLDLYLYNESTDQISANNYTPQTTTNTYYIIKHLVIPFGSSVVLEEQDLLIDYESPAYDVFVKLSGADSAVDIIINN